MIINPCINLGVQSNVLNIQTLSSAQSEVALFSSASFVNVLKDTFIANEKTTQKVDNKKKCSLNGESSMENAQKAIEILMVGNGLMNDEQNQYLSSLDSNPVFVDNLNNPQRIGLVSSAYLNQILNSISLEDRNSYRKVLNMLMNISSLMNASKITNLDVNSAELVAQSKTFSNSPNVNYFIPLYILSINIVHYINRYNVEAFDYKKEKQKMYEKMAKKEKERKARMLEFAAGFERKDPA